MIQIQAITFLQSKISKCIHKYISSATKHALPTGRMELKLCLFSSI
jgi:hypothetical protein